MKKVTSFASRLRELLDIKGITQAELCRLTGIDKGRMSHYIRGDYEAKQDGVYDIAVAAGVSEAWLMGYDISMERESVPPSPSNIFPLPEFVKKPRLGAIACGKPILANGESGIFDDVPASIHCDFTLLCKGDSMINARIFDGDIVYIRQQPEVESGEIAAVRIGDEATLKKVYYAPDSGRIILRACNPLHPDLEFDGDDLDNIEILGKAVAFTSMIRI